MAGKKERFIDSKGLKIITNGSGDSAERVLKLGADRFIDYKIWNALE